MRIVKMKAVCVCALVTVSALSAAQSKLPEGYLDSLLRDLVKEIPTMGLGWPACMGNDSVPNAVAKFASFGERAVPQMIPLLDSDKYWNVVVGALVLAELKDRSQIHKMALMAQDSPEAGVRQIVIQALGNLRAKEAIGAITSALDDEEEFVVSTAIRALGDIGDPSTIPLIVSRLGREVTSSFGTTSTSWAEVGALAKFGEAAIPVLEPLLKSGDKERAESALRALGEIRSDRTRQILLGALDDPELWSVAVNIFMTAQGQYDGDVLVRVFDRLDTFDQSWIAEILFDNKDPRAASLAARVWSRIYSDLVSGQATGYDLLLVLGNIEGVGFVPSAGELVDAVCRSEDRRVADYALDHLTFEQIDVCAARLLRWIKDWSPDYGDLCDIGETMAKAGSNSGTVGLDLVMRGEVSPEFREAVLTRMVRAEHAGRLREITRGRDRTLALYAAIGLARLGQSDAIAPLREFARSSDDATAAEALVALLKAGDRWATSEFVRRYSRVYWEYRVCDRDSEVDNFDTVSMYDRGMGHLDDSGKQLFYNSLRRHFGADKAGLIASIPWVLGVSGQWGRMILSEGSAKDKAGVLATMAWMDGGEDLSGLYRGLLHDPSATIRYRAYRYLKDRGEFQE